MSDSKQEVKKDTNLLSKWTAIISCILSGLTLILGPVGFLTLPLAVVFTLVSAASGSSDTAENTIVWVLSAGLIALAFFITPAGQLIYLFIANK